jgi:2-dehydro-3-deoxygluconokinase
MLEFAALGEGLYRRGFAGDTLNTCWHMAQLLGSYARAVQFSILSREFDSGCEVERGAEAGVLDVVDA